MSFEQVAHVAIASWPDHNCKPRNADQHHLDDPLSAQVYNAWLNKLLVQGSSCIDKQTRLNLTNGNRQGRLIGRTNFGETDGIKSPSQIARFFSLSLIYISYIRWLISFIQDDPYNLYVRINGSWRRKRWSRISSHARSRHLLMLIKSLL